MKGLWLENQIFTLRDDIPIPDLGPNDALVKVKLAGICGTDIQLAKGYYSYRGIPGHEFVGEVVASSSNTSLLGKRVVGEINIGCGECEYCRNHLKKHCLQRSVIGIKNHHGAFAEFVAIAIENLHAIPDSISDEQAVFVEPLAAALQIKKQVALHHDTKLLIIGAGRLGYLIAYALSKTVPLLKVIARYPNQIARLRNAGVETIDGREAAHKTWDVVVEATGSESGITQALNLVRPQGVIVLKSTYPGMTALPMAEIVVNEISIVGSRCGDFNDALEFLSRYSIDKLFIREPFTLDDWQNGFSAAKGHDANKILFRIAE